MTGRRVTRLLLAVLVAAAAAAAAVVLNLVLLGRASAQNDPVGQLRPRLTGAVSTTRRSPGPLLLPTRGKIENEGADD